MECSIVVPVYNGAETIPLLVHRIHKSFHELVDSYELILINDGSLDQSWETIVNLSHQFPWIVGINLLRNYGQHNALLCGIRTAKFNVIVTMDDDLQHPPEEITKLLSKMAEGYDVVYGIPQKIQQNLWRGLASRTTRYVLKSITGSEIAHKASPFRAFRTSTRDAFTNYSNPAVSIDVLLAWGASSYASVPIRYDPRFLGSSNYSFSKLLSHALNMLTGFSTLPLRITSSIGFTLTFFGIIVLFYVLGRYLVHGGSVPGFPFLASVIAIFSGATLFALGIMGEYLARIYIHSMGQPPYVIKMISGSEEDS